MSLGEDHERVGVPVVLVVRCHHAEYLRDEVVGNGLVEKVRHGVHEHPSRLPPPQWGAQDVGVHRQAEPRPAGLRVAITLILLRPH